MVPEIALHAMVKDINTTLIVAQTILAQVAPDLVGVSTVTVPADNDNRHRINAPTYFQRKVQKCELTSYICGKEVEVVTLTENNSKGNG